MKLICLSLLYLLTALNLFSQDSVTVKNEHDKPSIPKYERSKGYCGWAEVGINILPLGQHSRPDPFPSPSIRLFNGARLSRHVTVGLETGLDASTQIPINAKVRVNILKRKITPFADFSAGYSFFFLYSNSHGFNFSPSAGFKVSGKKVAFTFRAGYYGIYGKAYNTGPSVISPDYHTGLPFRYLNGIHVMTGVEF